MANDLPKVGAEAVLIHDKYDRDIADVIKRADKADKALDDISGTVDVKINVDDGEIKTAAGLADDLDSTISTKVNVDDSDLDTAADTLDDIATIGAIDLAINVAGSAKGFFEGLGRFSGVGGVVELDNALASIEGRTGRMIPDAEKLITDLYTNGWGESREAIANTIVEAANLKIANDDLAEATQKAFEVQAATGGETNEILRAMDSLVKNNLVGSYTEAADLITTGFQTGNDRGQDLLDTFNEYGSTFQELKVSGPGALALINSGLDAGVDNSDRIADAIRETGIRLGEIGTDENIANAFKQLDDLSDIDLAATLDAYNAGEISGDEFFNGFFAAIGDAQAVDPEKAQSLSATLVGTISEDFGTEQIAELTTTWDTDVMGVMEGRAKEAGSTISNTLDTSVDTLLRTMEQGAVDFLSSDAIDLPGKIEDIKAGITEALAVLQNGGTLGEALEVSFGIEGVDTALANIERVFGQFVLAVLEIVATIQDPTGLGDADKGTRAEIARLATQQLPFDIKVANPEELDAIFKQAAGRGVTDLGAGLTTALDELMAEGDFSKLIDITDVIMQSPDITPEAKQVFADKYITPLGTAFDEAIESGDFDLAKKISDAQNDPTAFTDAIKGKFGFDAASFDQMAADFAAGMETAIAAETPTPEMAWADLWKVPDDVTTSITDFETDVDTAMENAALVSSLASDDMLLALAAMSDGVVTADEEIALHLTDNTVTASFDEVALNAATNFPIVIDYVDQTADSVQRLDELVRGLAGGAGILEMIGNAVDDFPLDRLQAISDAAMGLGGAQTIVNNNGGDTTVTVTNNNTNGAQANTTPYDIGRALGGG